MPRMAPVTLARAGAITTLNRIGVISGTMISRGVLAERAKRRLVSVAKGAVIERAAGRRIVTGLGAVVVMAVIGISLSDQAARRSPVRRRYTSSSVGGRALMAPAAMSRSAMAAMAWRADRSCTGTVRV